MTLTPDTTRGAAQRLLARRFAEAEFDSAALDARLLLCAALGVDHVALVRDPDERLGAAAFERLEAYAARRLAAEPVSRILGFREFWGLPFIVTPDVLDPRPDTEVLVEAVLERLGPRRAAPLRLVDFGTGSGAILCALLHELPMAFGLGVDISLAACQVARRNLAALGLAERGFVTQGSWAEALAGGLDVVVSNPPYIAQAELAGLEDGVRLYDPMGALAGGLDGLDPYRVLVPRLPHLLNPDGIAAFEGGPGQSREISALMADAGLADVVVRHDIQGHDRVTLGRKP